VFTLLFFLHHENGDFSILMKDIHFVLEWHMYSMPVLCCGQTIVMIVLARVSKMGAPKIAFLQEGSTQFSFE
jgi:hypothetical protein